MAGAFGFHAREAVRVKVKKCEGHLQPEYRKFSVDPQITSFEVLQSLLGRAFDIKGEFAISYLAKDDVGQETYLALLSDWDLDAAFLSASEPCLRLKVDLRPFEEGLEDWDIIAPVDIPRTAGSAEKPTLAGTILNQMEKTLSMVQRALNLTGENMEAYKPIKAPMCDAELQNFLDSDGQLVRTKELRLSIYQGGLEPSLRRVVWKHLLNVYPEGMSGKERLDYMKRKSYEYFRLRDMWQSMVGNGTVTDDVQQAVTNMVRKDVLRTDRTHKFYAGADDNKNVVSLFNLLTTYALNHPSVSYCQGMSDLASPLLVTMWDEAHAYVCFCALMKRLKPCFLLDGQAMTIRFTHLSDALQAYDPEFYEYLKELGADDLLFCYRWLLLELKREFAFDDALRMLEVLWSSLPPNPPKDELELCEVEFSPLSPHSPKPPGRENAYTKVRAMRRQSSASSICGARGGNSAAAVARSDGECKVQTPSRTLLRQESFADGDGTNDDYFPMTTSVTRELRMEYDQLNSRLPGSSMYHSLPPESPDRPIASTPSSEEGCSDSDLSSGDQIRRVGECQRSPRRLVAEPPPSTQQNVRDRELELLHCNGEIMEVADSDLKSQLKCVVPIRLVRGRSSEDARRSSDSSDSTHGDGKGTPSEEHALDTSGGSKEVFESTEVQRVILDSNMTNSCEEASESIGYSCSQHPRNCHLLPPPQEFGGGNPFMIFLCLTLLLQHREYIVKNRMNYIELAMHFNKRVRKHNVNRVLHQARGLFAEYLRSGWQQDFSSVEYPDLNV